MSFAMSMSARARSCMTMRLSVEEAAARNEWAKKCFPDMAYVLTHVEQAKPRYVAVQSKSSGSWDGPIDASAPCGDWEIQVYCE